MVDLSKYGDWALVAGAAEGIGEAFCEYLAARNINLILLDIKGEKNHLLAEKLSNQFNIQTEPIEIDLAETEATQQILRILKSRDCRMIIYNAAYGPVKSFLDNTPEELDRYLDVNCRTPVHLIHQVIPHWKSKPAAIILMSSLAGLFGTQLVAPYSATKAFDINLGEALYYEFKPKNIDVLVCCAGATNTPNFQKTQPDLSIFPKPNVGDPHQIPREAFKKLGKKAVHIVNFTNRANYFILSRILSRNRASAIFNGTMLKLYKTKIGK